MIQYGLTEQEVRKRAAESYGSLEYAMQAMETPEAAIERAFPNRHAKIQVEVIDVAFLNLKTDFPTCSQCQRKPKPGEEVTFSQLRDDLMVRHKFHGA